MPFKTEVIDLADDDPTEQYESISIPDDIEEIEAMPVAGPSKSRDEKAVRVRSTSGEDASDCFDKRQSISAKLAKLDVEVRYDGLLWLTRCRSRASKIR
jgi:hypothetical protein